MPLFCASRATRAPDFNEPLTPALLEVAQAGGHGALDVPQRSALVKSAGRIGILAQAITADLQSVPVAPPVEP